MPTVRMGRFVVTGTDTQIGDVRAALAACAFPVADRLPRDIPVRYTDLSSYNAAGLFWTDGNTPRLVDALRGILQPAPEPPAADPLAGFPYRELDAWAARARPWWASYSRRAAIAYQAWAGPVDSRTYGQVDAPGSRSPAPRSSS